MKLTKRLQAEQFRQNGKSIKEIAKSLSVSVSSVSRWCSNIILSKQQIIILEDRRREAGRLSLAPWVEKNRKSKIQDIGKQQLLGRQDVGKFTKRDLFILGLGLYWGEGYKRGSQEWGFTNSDPALLRTAMHWVEEFYKIDKSRFIVHVTINENYKIEDKAIQKFWSKELNIPVSQFNSSTFIKGSLIIGRDPKTYKGTVRLKIRNSTSLRRRVLASISTLSEQS